MLNTRESAEPNPSKLPFEFGELYRSYYGLVFSACFRVAKDSDLARDLTHDTFLIALRKLQQYRGDASLSSWLYQVARNTALMYMRDQHPKIAHESLDDWETRDEKRSVLECALAKDDRRLRSADCRVLLEKEFEHAASGYGCVLLLHDFYGYDHSEIGRLMGICEGTSKAQLFKARRRFRARMKSGFSLRMGQDS